MAAKSGGENDCWEKSPVQSTDTLWVKSFAKITPSCSVSQINTFFCFTQKFKMAAKSGGKTLLCKKSPVHSADTLRVKNFLEIALSRSVSEINTFLNFTLKFKMATKSGGKMIFGKSR